MPFFKADDLQAWTGGKWSKLDPSRKPEIRGFSNDSRNIGKDFAFVAIKAERDGHDFAANNELLLRNLEGVGNRRARFRTVISLILDGEEHLFEGIVEGHIAQCASGSEGFGYDPLFIPEGSAKTYAEMDPAEKNALSHRGRAVRKLAEFLHNRGK